MLLYLIGFVSAIGVAWIMKSFMKSKERSFFVMELPMYRVPRWSSIGLHIMEKVKIFLFDAGKIIISISIILWVLSSFGPSGEFDRIEQKYSEGVYTSVLPQQEIDRKIQSEKLEASYAGMLGHVIEPVIRPKLELLSLLLSRQGKSLSEQCLQYIVLEILIQQSIH